MGAGSVSDGGGQASLIVSDGNSRSVVGIGGGSQFPGNIVGVGGDNTASPSTGLEATSRSVGIIDGLVSGVCFADEPAPGIGCTDLSCWRCSC